MSTEIGIRPAHADGGHELRILRFCGSMGDDRVRVQFAVGEVLDDRRHVFDRRSWRSVADNVDRAFAELPCTTLPTNVIEGKVVENPHGDWSDVDRGLYVGGEQIVPYDMYPMPTFLSDYVGKKVRITIEEMPEEE